MKHKVRDPLTGKEKVVETSSGLPEDIERAFQEEAEAKANSPAAKLLGLPMQGVNAVARWGARAQGLPVDDSATVGGMLRSAVLPAPEAAPPLTQGGADQTIKNAMSRVAGPVLEEGANVAMDPSMWLGGGKGASAAGVPRVPKGMMAKIEASVGHPPPAPGSAGLWEKLAAEAREARAGSVRLGAPPPVGTSDILGVKQTVGPPAARPQVQDILKRVKAQVATENLQKPAFRSEVAKISQELGTTQPPTHLGSGYFHDVYDLGATASGQPVVLRANSAPLSGQENLQWPKSEHIVQPLQRKVVKGSLGEPDRVLEVIPKVPKAALTDAEMDTLRQGLLKEGYALVDAVGTGGNVTKINGKPMVVDPGAVVKIADEQAYQKYRNMQIPPGKAFDAERQKALDAVARRAQQVAMGLGAGVLSKMFIDNSGGIGQPPLQEEVGVP